MYKYKILQDFGTHRILNNYDINIIKLGRCRSARKAKSSKWLYQIIMNNIFATVLIFATVPDRH